MIKYLITFFIFVSFLFSVEKLTLQKQYFFKNDIYAKTLTPNIKINFLVIKVKKTKPTFKLPASAIIYEYRKHNVSLNSRFSYITFMYQMDYDKDRIINFIKKKYYQKYKNIEIKNLTIKPTLYESLTGYSIKDILFKDILLKRPKGTFSVLFENGNKRLKIYFKYRLNAILPVFQVTKKIRAGESITSINTNKVIKIFDNMFYIPITEDKISKVSARHILPIGKIVTEKDLGKKFLVKINQKIIGNIVEDGVNLKFIGISLGNGDIGDKVKVRLKNKKVLNTVIIGKAKVEVQ